MASSLSAETHAPKPLNVRCVWKKMRAPIDGCRSAASVFSWAALTSASCRFACQLALACDAPAPRARA